MWRAATLLVAGLACAVPALAAERIIDYHSEIEVHADASMTVTETIVVEAAGQLIRRGIYRDFPTDYRDRLGNRYRVGFEVLAVTRNGRSEPFHTERHANGVRVYAGRADVFVEPGRHEYTIRYRTDRQLGYFEAHDELYWNVTGNGWDFPTERAGAVVRLPADVPMGEVTPDAYTGPPGSTEQSYAVAVSGDEVSFVATRSLGAREGLTVVVGWPKGYVHEPGRAERLQMMLADNRGLLLAGTGALLILGYLLWAWLNHGRDPRAGVIFPHYEPPPGYSPASARFILRMKYDDRAFTAAILSLAVKGYLSIEEADGKYTLRVGKSQHPLAAGEKALLDALFAADRYVEMEKSNHAVLRRAKLAHRKSLRRDYQKRYFFTNSMLLAPSIVAAIALALAINMLGAFTPAVAAVFIVLAAAHVLFYHLLPAPTALGRRLMDKLEGFRMYLEVAEKDELNLRNPPARTPELFERYLPFALALGVEQRWAEKFAAVFAGLAAADGSGYQLRWYGGDFNPRQLGHFTAGVGASLNAAISSASTPPGSSSGGGGGGSSGGGGGGGGGGGW
ncbi:MAG TPA: DUF2207 domain-containing protein [Gammaproteobacteria bacterium]|nr:DUF2207 domain-containing protein [Gammaproteobacteria bacterium]